MTLDDIAHPIGSIHSRKKFENVHFPEEVLHFLMYNTDPSMWEGLAGDWDEHELRAVIELLDSELKSGSPFDESSEEMQDEFRAIRSKLVEMLHE